MPQSEERRRAARDLRDSFPHNGQRYRCTFADCHFQHKTRDQVLRHYQIKHDNRTEKTLTLPCPESGCDSCASNWNVYSTHKNHAHSTPKPCPVKDCDFSNQRRAIWNHLRSGKSNGHEISLPRGPRTRSNDAGFYQKCREVVAAWAKQNNRTFDFDFFGLSAKISVATSTAEANSARDTPSRDTSTVKTPGSDLDDSKDSELPGGKDYESEAVMTTSSNVSESGDSELSNEEDPEREVVAASTASSNVDDPEHSEFSDEEDPEFEADTSSTSEPAAEHDSPDEIHAFDAVSAQKHDQERYGKDLVAFLTTLGIYPAQITHAVIREAFRSGQFLGSKLFSRILAPHIPSDSLFDPRYRCLGLAISVMAVYETLNFASLTANLDRYSKLFQEFEQPEDGIVEYHSANNAFYDLVYGFYIKNLIDMNDTWFKHDHLLAIIKSLGDGSDRKGGKKSETTGVAIWGREVEMNRNTINTLEKSEREKFYRECWRKTLEDWLSNHGTEAHESIGHWWRTRIKLNVSEWGLKVVAMTFSDPKHDDQWSRW